MVTRSPWFYYLLALLALIPGSAGLRTQRGIAALPADLSMAALRFPLDVGGVRADTPAELRFLVERHRIGEKFILAARPAPIRVRLVPRLTARHHLITLLSGCLFGLVAIAFFAPRARAPAAPIFFWCCLLYGLAVCIGGVYCVAPGSSPAALLNLAQIASLALLPALFLHLTLIFPDRATPARQAGWLVPAAYLTAVLLAAWEAAAYFRYFGAPDPAHWRAIVAPLTASRLFMVTSVGAGGALLFRSGRHAPSERLARQARWLLFGFAIGIVPYVYLRTLPAIMGLSSPLPPEFDRLLELAIPVTFVLAVARQRLLDIDVILRRSLLYGALATLFIAFYLAIGLRVATALGRSFPAAAPLVLVLVGVVAAVLYASLRRIIGRLVDRLFFKLDYEQDRSLAGLEVRLAHAAGSEALAEELHRFLAGTLAPAPSAVLLSGRAEIAAAGDAAPGEGESLLDRAADLSQGEAEPVAAVGQTSQPAAERPDFPAEWLAAGFGLLQPIALAGRTLGLVLLGAKRSERHYVEEDLRLLAGAAARTAQALDRVNLVQAAAEAALQRRQLRELDDAKNDFLSRVAHDLRTPLTAITWSAQNLLDGVAGPLAERPAESVRAIRAATNQLARLVRNLLEISRLELGRGLPRPTAVCVPALLEEVALSLSDQAAARHLRIRVDCGGELNPVRADRDHLFQIVFNLLENALKYSPDGGVVDVRLSAGEAGWQTLEVRDHGPGIPEAERERIFERFAQGPASPGGGAQGFGLGLWVVRSHLEAMGGSVRVEDAPEGGAFFICRLPEWVAELEAVS